MGNCNESKKKLASYESPRLQSLGNIREVTHLDASFACSLIDIDPVTGLCRDVTGTVGGLTGGLGL